jgi:hypothetical protein
VLAPLGRPDDGTGRDRETTQRDDETGREWAAENLVGVFRRLYAAWWGPRMDDVLRAACLTLVRRPGATLAEVIPMLTRPEFRHTIITKHGEPEGLDGFWDSYDALTPGQRNQLAGPVLSRLRSVLSRRFARDLLGTTRSTINLADILDGGILIARLPKGEIGEHAAQLVGSLLLSGLWSAATRRAALAPEDRRDATVVVDECHNFLHLPIGVDDALAEARGYRLSLVLAHQHLTQLPPDVRDAVDANAATSCSSWSRPPTRRNWCGTWLPISTNMTSPAVPRSRSWHAPSTTDTTCRLSPSTPNRSGHRFQAAPNSSGPLRASGPA